MSVLLSAIALAAAAPATPAPPIAPTRSPAPASEKKCCCKDMAQPMSCCPKHGAAAEPAPGHGGHDGHEGH